MSGVAGQVSTEILERLLSLENPSRDDVNRLKNEVCRKYRSPLVPSNSQNLKLISESLLPKLGPLLIDKQVRSLSGVTTVAVMPKPYGCPHGKCTYCPGGPDEGVPRAYTGKEPAVMRALESGYDPYLQVESRLRQLRGMGHPVDKVELILVGGTFPFMPRFYQEDFVKRCLDALNGEDSGSLDEAKVRSQNARIKNVGVTIETRPDWSRRGHVDHMLSMGVTRVEIGVQTLYDDVYERIHRDHRVADVVEATRTLKDSARDSRSRHSGWGNEWKPPPARPGRTRPPWYRMPLHKVPRSRAACHEKHSEPTYREYQTSANSLRGVGRHRDLSFL